MRSVSAKHQANQAGMRVANATNRALFSSIAKNFSASSISPALAARCKSVAGIGGDGSKRLVVFFFSPSFLVTYQGGQGLTARGRPAPCAAPTGVCAGLSAPPRPSSNRSAVVLLLFRRRPERKGCRAVYGSLLNHKRVGHRNLA